MELFKSEVETRLPASFAIAFPIAVPRAAFPVLLIKSPYTLSLEPKLRR